MLNHQIYKRQEHYDSKIYKTKDQYLVMNG